MVLLRKKKNDGSYFDFNMILRNGYEINEQQSITANKKLVNGKRKRIYANYIDCSISVDLGLLDNNTYQEYKEYLTDGEYQYYSLKENRMKNANFLINNPSIVVEYNYGNNIGIDDMTITLEKSSDVE